MCVYIAHHYMFHTAHTVLYIFRYWTTNGPVRLARHQMVDTVHKLLYTFEFEGLVYHKWTSAPCMPLHAIHTLLYMLRFWGLVDHNWTSANDHSDCDLHYGSSTAIADCRIFLFLGYVLGGGGVVGLQAAARMKLFQLFWRQHMWQAVMKMYAGSVCSKKKTNGHAKSVKHKVRKCMTIMYDKMCDNNLISCQSCRAKTNLQSQLIRKFYKSSSKEWHTYKTTFGSNTCAHLCGHLK